MCYIKIYIIIINMIFKKKFKNVIKEIILSFLYKKYYKNKSLFNFITFFRYYKSRDRVLNRE